MPMVAFMSADNDADAKATVKSGASRGTAASAPAMPRRLLEGYRRFRRDTFPTQRSLLETLAQGQSPRIMIIACADSRVDPATIFQALPGELFIIRNVANLVPPFEEEGTFHGTSAALEFAVTGLEVSDIVVLGHARCGGIAACLAAGEGGLEGRFVGPWVALAAKGREEVVQALPNASPEERQRALELAAIRHSLDHLMTFDFVRDQCRSNHLTLHGAWFSIASGELHWLDRTSGRFAPVPVED